MNKYLRTGTSDCMGGMPEEELEHQTTPKITDSYNDLWILLLA